MLLELFWPKISAIKELKPTEKNSPFSARTAVLAVSDNGFGNQTPSRILIAASMGRIRLLVHLPIEGAKAAPVIAIALARDIMGLGL